MVALEAALQFEDTRESMHAFCVGQYLEVRPARSNVGDIRGSPLCVCGRMSFSWKYSYLGPLEELSDKHEDWL